MQVRVRVRVRDTEGRGESARTSVSGEVRQGEKDSAAGDGTHLVDRVLRVGRKTLHTARPSAASSERREAAVGSFTRRRTGRSFARSLDSLAQNLARRAQTRTSARVQVVTRSGANRPIPGAPPFPLVCRHVDAAARLGRRSRSGPAFHRAGRRQHVRPRSPADPPRSPGQARPRRDRIRARSVHVRRRRRGANTQWGLGADRKDPLPHSLKQLALSFNGGKDCALSAAAARPTHRRW